MQKKHVKITLQAKIKLNSVKVLNIDSNISLDEFVLIKNEQKQYFKIKKKKKKNQKF